MTQAAAYTLEVIIAAFIITLSLLLIACTNFNKLTSTIIIAETYMCFVSSKIKLNGCGSEKLLKILSECLLNLVDTINNRFTYVAAGSYERRRS